jgi:hypothetical protein
MALSGQLSDLSLAELIEFFCNQRKTGRLKVSYPRAPGFFYFQKGALVDAKIGALSGVEAIYYAFTLENASFKFSASFEPTRRTIHQPWAQVALEGLRRMDEGIAPSEAFPDGHDISFMEDADGANEIASLEEEEAEAALPLPKRAPRAAQESEAPLSLTVENASGGGRKMMIYGSIAAAVLVSVAAVGFPAGWYGKRKPPVAAQPAAASTEQMTNNSGSNSSDSNTSQTADSSSTAQDTESAGPVNDSEALAARRAREARERERWKAAEAKAEDAAAVKPGTTPAPTDAAKKPEPAKPKTMTVQVTYDEAGRVTGASGGDANAMRIARQKRFPAGKAGSATVTIPVN